MHHLIIFIHRNLKCDISLSYFGVIFFYLSSVTLGLISGSVWCYFEFLFSPEHLSNQQVYNFHIFVRICQFDKFSFPPAADLCMCNDLFTVKQKCWFKLRTHYQTFKDVDDYEKTWSPHQETGFTMMTETVAWDHRLHDFSNPLISQYRTRMHHSLSCVPPNCFYWLLATNLQSGQWSLHITRLQLKNYPSHTNRTLCWLASTGKHG